MATQTHSERAMAAALQAMGNTSPGTSAVLLFLAAAKYLGEVADPEMAAEIAYKAADELATRGMA